MGFLRYLVKNLVDWVDLGSRVLRLLGYGYDVFMYWMRGDGGYNFLRVLSSDLKGKSCANDIYEIGETMCQLHQLAGWQGR